MAPPSQSSRSAGQRWRLLQRAPAPIGFGRWHAKSIFQFYCASCVTCRWADEGANHPRIGVHAKVEASRWRFGADSANVNWWQVCRSLPPIQRLPSPFWPPMTSIWWDRPSNGELRRKHEWFAAGSSPETDNVHSSPLPLIGVGPISMNSGRSRAVGREDGKLGEMVGRGSHEMHPKQRLLH